MEKPITIILAEDHAIVREGLRNLLSSEPAFKVVAEAANGREAVELARKWRPAVVVMDIAMPHLNGLEATRQILQSNPGTKVLILSAHDDSAYIEHVRSAGAAGYLLKQTSFRELARAIHGIMKGFAFFSGGARSSRENKNHQASNNPLPQLTPRELEVLQLIAEGQMNKQIAIELSISIKTVEKHRQNLMDKLRIHDTAGLTRYAITAGIIESSVQLTVLGAKLP